jgi:hypothetical protein
MWVKVNVESVNSLGQVVLQLEFLDEHLENSIAHYTPRLLMEGQSLKALVPKEPHA